MFHSKVSEQQQKQFIDYEIANYIFLQIKDIVCSNQDELQAAIMPISLAEVCYEYRYGIFAEQHLS